MQINTGLGKKTAKLACFVALVFTITACTAVIRKHGYIPTDEELDSVIVGVDTVETLESTVGSPSGRGILKDGDWFYVESLWKNYGYREPKEIDRQVVAIRFDDKGVVSNVERFGIEDGQVVALSRRVTDSGISGVGFLAQMFGSFGNLTGSALTGN
ncbi:outer membrane protein assembly factor BamE [Falsihalocynthiibacter arcticus]|uniref:Cell envelope protein SmpA n=1 Tax=Falsihalocynthiibacter arcticus TaxID=1579316 RepID=A0A126V2I8_9RHOB|nr:outer membrane protein assembly factor BamE [Falsihalocynthiibacter arcticus]AML52532.1 cell envelope protein SmpA [Falsihalocynthiibacter arcticus]